jgi:superfamily II DNA or RNA helicase
MSNLQNNPEGSLNLNNSQNVINPKVEKPLTELETYLKNNNLQDLLYVNQMDAVEWMYHMCKQGKGCLNSLSMGLGKTLISCILFQLVLPRMALVIAPTSCVFSQWIRNLCRFSFYFKIYRLKSNKVTQYQLAQDGTLIVGQTCFLHELQYDPYPYKIVVTNFNGVVPYPSVAGRGGITGNKFELSQPLGYYDPEITPLNSTVWDIVLVDEIHNIGNGINTRLDPGEKRDKQLRFYRLSRLRMNP